MDWGPEAFAAHMANRLARLFLLAPLVGAPLAAPAHGYIANDRWGSTATNPSTGAQGTPITLTWSFAPDTTLIPDNPSGTLPSDLISFLDTTFGVGPGGDDLTQRPWFASFDQSFARLSAVSGVTYVYEPQDDGYDFADPFFDFSARGILGVRGDVRLGGKTYGPGSNILASNFFPDFGEMMINTTQGALFSNSFNDYLRLRNTLMHEAMHGLGISHVDSDAAFLIEPVSTVAFDGPQLDDILALQRLYGDALEKNGGNDLFSTATPLGIVSETQSLARGTQGDTTAVAASATDFLSIDDASDTDFFQFTLDAPLDVSILLTPKGTTYNVGPSGGTQAPYDSRAASNLSLALFDANGTTQLGPTIDANGAGAGESMFRRLDPGQYFARVRGDQSEVQLYQISVTTGFLTWVGDGSTVWDIETTPNFSSGFASEVFHNQNDVTFDDSAVTTTVVIPAPVSPDAVVVHTMTSYAFTGAGGLVDGSLTINGDGVVELANAGNSYDGATTVAAGTLKITGNANAMVSPITIADGAKLIMAATDATTMASSFTIQPGGVLEIGATGSTTNVFPDSPAAIANEGTIRVFDSEGLSNVSGSGAITLESETVQLAGNGGFDGALTVNTSAVADVRDDSGLGSTSGNTVVNDGGTVLVNVNLLLAEPFVLEGNGDGSGAIHVGSGQSTTFLGNVGIAGAGAVLGVDAGSSAVFSGAVDAAQPNPVLTLRVGDGSDIHLTGATTVGNGGLVKTGSGTAELTGAIDFAGPTMVDQGLLRLAGSGQLGREFRVAAGATIEVAGVHEFLPSATLSGNGQVSGNIVMPGTILPGDSVGALTFVDDLALTPSSVLEIEIAGSTAGVDYDWLNVGGQAELDGALQMSLIGGFSPAAGDSFAILTASQVAGNFNDVELPSLEPGLLWQIAYLSDQVLLSVASVGDYDADFNSDSVVDGADRARWQAGFGAVWSAPCTLTAMRTGISRSTASIFSPGNGSSSAARRSEG